MEIVMTLHGSKNVLNKQKSNSTSYISFGKGWVRELIGNGGICQRKKGTHVIEDDTKITIRSGAAIDFFQFYYQIISHLVCTFI